jgi:DegV family protein with EDD domain
MTENLKNDRVVIITDSGADWLPDEPAEYGIEVLQITVTPDGRTAAVSEREFAETAEKWLKQGYDVIIIPLSSGLSSSCENAEQAAAYLALKYPERRINCVDSLCGSRAQAWLCVEARKKLRASQSYDAVVDWLKKIRHHIQIWITTADLEALDKSGRLPKPAATALNIFGGVPIAKLTVDGRLAPAGFATRKSVVNSLGAHLKRVTDRKSISIAVLHTGGLANAEELASVMQQALGQAVPVMRVGSVVGAHLGKSPDTVAFAVVGKRKK